MYVSTVRSPRVLFVIIPYIMLQTLYEFMHRSGKSTLGLYRLPSSLFTTATCLKWSMPHNNRSSRTTFFFCDYIHTHIYVCNRIYIYILFISVKHNIGDTKKSTYVFSISRRLMVTCWTYEVDPTSRGNLLLPFSGWRNYNSVDAEVYSCIITSPWRWWLKFPPKCRYLPN